MTRRSGGEDSGEASTVRPGWIRILVGGLIWAAVYNVLWGSAWIGFMRRAWTEAAAAAGRSMPWTPDFWAVWVPMTLPFGLAVSAYLASRPHRPTRRDVAAATLVVWIPGTLGMALWAAFTPGIVVLDSAVNLVAVLAASLVTSEVSGRRGAPSSPLR